MRPCEAAPGAVPHLLLRPTTAHVGTNLAQRGGGVVWMRPLIDGRALHHQEEAVPVIEQLDRLLLLLWVVVVRIITNT